VEKMEEMMKMQEMMEHEITDWRVQKNVRQKDVRQKDVRQKDVKAGGCEASDAQAAKLPCVGVCGKSECAVASHRAHIMTSLRSRR